MSHWTDLEKAYYELSGGRWEIWCYAEGSRFVMAHRSSPEACETFGMKYGYKMVKV